MTPLDHALALWRCGFSVIPVPRPDARQDGDVPTFLWKRYQTERPTEAQLREWFSGAPQNLAIVTGAVSGIVVVEADSRAGLRWCARHLCTTPWQIKTARGFHLIYRYPGVRVHARAPLDTGGGRLQVDVRGDGGYVLGPGSVDASGHLYTLAGDWTRNHVPRFWSGWLRPTARLRPPPPSDPPPACPRVRSDARLARVGVQSAR